LVLDAAVVAPDEAFVTTSNLTGVAIQTTAVPDQASLYPPNSLLAIAVATLKASSQIPTLHPFADEPRHRGKRPPRNANKARKVSAYHNR
jgi:hypothetical protein